jgi:hypothetical protein
MKPQSANSVVVSVRCAHRSSGGRRCRLSVSDPHSVFCPQHRSEQLEEEAADHYQYLSSNYQDFQTAQGINHSLHNLYALLAQNRISPRRAAVLSHICGLLLRTLPQIDADRAAGIIDPTKPVPTNALASDEDADSEENFDLDSDDDSDVRADSESDTPTQTEAEKETSIRLDSANTWDPSIPEPDPNKKPS